MSGRDKARNKRIAMIARRNEWRTEALVDRIDRLRSANFRQSPSAHVGRLIVVENNGRVIAETLVVDGDTDFAVAERLAIAVSRNSP